MFTPRRAIATLATTALAIGGLTIAAGSAQAAPAVELTVCASGCDYATIQAAVTAATAGDVVVVSAGSYTEKVTVSKAITIQGAGSGVDPATATIISGTGNGLTLSGAVDNPVIVRDLRVTGFTTGIVVGSHVTLDGVASSGNTNYGISLNNNATNLTIIDSAFDANKVGLKLGSQASASHITITGSSFDDNTGQGWYSDKNLASGSTLTHVSITDTTFNGNGDKGFYTEKLSDATFTNVEFSNSGNTRPTQGAGLDLNLKYGDYSDIALIDVIAIDSGTEATVNGTGLTISARNDAPSYSANPATLTGLSIDGGQVNGSGTGIFLGFGIEDDITVSGVDLSGNGIALANATPSHVDASRNWWGSAAPDFGALISGAASTAPWYLDAAMTTLGVAPTPGDPVVPVPATPDAIEVVMGDDDEPLVDLAALTDEDGVITFDGAVTVVGSTGATVAFAPGTVVTPSDPDWGTEFIALAEVPTGSVSAPGTVAVAVKLGSDEVSFQLDRAARILLPGAAGTSAGFLAPGGVFTPISTVCAADSQEAGDAVANDCAIAVGDDLVIWTKHFTVFAAYAPALAATGAVAVAPWLLGSLLLLFGALVFGAVVLRTRIRLSRAAPAPGR